ncbi:MAG TPA: sensor domain-containing diguanylate cyclase, partial [Smithellaceae bacterium]|nr:sensor domain-containing diguanylate cyclase [Smithellaceae bacterium]
FCKILGYSPDEIADAGYKKITDEENSQKFFRAFNFVFATGIPNPCINFNVVCNGGLIKDVEVSVSLIKTVQGRPAGFRGIMRDVTERKKNEEMIAYMAYHDPLTGLPNRRLFDDRLYDALKLARRGGMKLAVLMIDLDSFKEVNEALGRRMGDMLLREVGGRLACQIRKSDTLARLGGDEFMMLLMPEIKRNEDVDVAAGRIIRAFRDPFICKGMELYTSVSMGVAIFPDHGDDVEKLISRADIAMYEVKNSGRNNFKIFQ